ncbi:hypothetical protein AVEN_4511-1 [Araneus ventricosus]|uniref:Uncharacterized protein n=1 Tax=Araneus ventricosus TaxID=182803 RepID=A0A4Y2BKL7_ARAVE|nr:hypothetical protein AVEN_4511-1 [Araneus ventricosus]
MMKTTPELAPPLQDSSPHQRVEIWPLRMIYSATGPIHDGSSVESGSVEPVGPEADSLPLGHRGSEIILQLWHLHIFKSKVFIFHSHTGSSEVLWLFLVNSI